MPSPGSYGHRMTADAHGTAPLSLRERRRAVATQEIVDAAERHITGHGPAALSLRAIARDLGMTVQALYHYFPNRDAALDRPMRASARLAQARPPRVRRPSRMTVMARLGCSGPAGRSRTHPAEVAARARYGMSCGPTSSRSAPAR